MADPFGNEFDKKNFPPIPDPANEDTGKSELYPKSLQDTVNEAYNHDKVLPRVEGVDFEPDKTATLWNQDTDNQEESFK